MVLESTIICVDNSQFMRNGDFHPTRLQAQQVSNSPLQLRLDFYTAGRRQSDNSLQDEVQPREQRGPDDPL